MMMALLFEGRREPSLPNPAPLSFPPAASTPVCLCVVVDRMCVSSRSIDQAPPPPKLTSI